MKTLILALACVLCGGICLADDTALHLKVDKPLTPVTTALASLSHQAGIPILADNTVVDTLGLTSIDQPGLEPMLDTLVKIIPALSWQKIYLPKDAPLPDADALSAQVRTLKAIPLTTITVWDPMTHSLVFYAADKSSTAGENGAHQLVYLVTNEVVRQQRIDNAKKAAAAKAEATQGPVNQAVGGLQNAAELLGQMTPDEQRKALPLMFQQFRQMIQNINPSVMSDLRKMRPGRPQNGQ